MVVDTMENLLRILNLEDVATDAELIERELRNGQIACTIRRVETREAFVEALDVFAPEVILADYSLPTFDGLSALAIARDTCPGVSFIFVSGAIGEERAIEALKQGAVDYVLKDRLLRLVPSVRRALREAEERLARRRAEEALRKAHDELEQRVKERTAELSAANTELKAQIAERKQAEAALRESEDRLSRILASAMDAIVAIDENGRIILFNEAAEQVFRCRAARAIGQPFERFLCDGLCALLEERIAAIEAGGAVKRYLGAPEDLPALRANGETFPIEATISQVEVGGRRLFTIILRDVKERWQAEAALNRLQQENVYLQEELKQEHNFEEIVGASRAIQEVFKGIEQVAGTDATVLISGETGTGKELVARAIHNRSRRKDSTLIKVNCAALPASLIENELFGHEKGAFTGATTQCKGRFELADGGTLFLDEVGELPPETQIKLLRVLQEREFERIGGTRTIKVDVRLVGASNRDLEASVKDGSFRADLFYRLNIFPIHIPPLRERRDDIPLLVDHFINKFTRSLGKHVDGVDPRAMDQLVRYAWPGNVRELANVIERATILCEGHTLLQKHLGLSTNSVLDEPGLMTIEEAERQAILKAFETTGWVIGGPKGAARLLGLPRTTLLYRMKKLNITRPNERAVSVS